MSSLKTYVLSSQAEIDLEEIFEYSYSKFGLDQAVKYVMEFDGLFEKILRNPKMGKSRNELINGIMSFPKDSHVVFYWMHDEVLEVLRVLHKSMDMIEHIKA